jgi:hypothetical protein
LHPFPCPHPSSGASDGLCGRWRGQDGRRDLVCKPLPQPALSWSRFSKLLRLTSPELETPFVEPAAVLPHHATLGCAVARGAPSSSLITLLGRNEEPRDRKGTKAGAWRLPARAALSGEEDGSPSACSGDQALSLGLAAPGSSASAGDRSSKAVYLPCPLLRHCGSAPCPSQPGKSSCHSHCGALPPGAEPAPATLPRARVHTRHTQTHARAPTDMLKCRSVQWEPVLNLWCSLGAAGIIEVLLTGRALVGRRS